MQHSISILARSTFTNVTSDFSEDQYAPDDYGGGFDDDDNHNDQVFDNFMSNSNEEGVEKYSSNSFVENEMNTSEFPPFSSSTEETNTNTIFLDAVCDGDVLKNNGEYNYFDEHKMESIIAGNQWAGCAHWKKSGRVRSKPKRFEPSLQEEQTKKKDQKRKKRKETAKETKTKALIDLKSCHKCLDKLINDNKKGRVRKSKTDSSQFSQAMVQKYSKERNILPQDAEIGVKQFSTMFMRPDTTISELKSQPSQLPRKSVGKTLMLVAFLLTFLFFTHPT